MSVKQTGCVKEILYILCAIIAFFLWFDLIANWFGGFRRPTSWLQGIPLTIFTLIAYFGLTKENKKSDKEPSSKKNIDNTDLEK